MMDERSAKSFYTLRLIICELALENCPAGVDNIKVTHPCRGAGCRCPLVYCVITCKGKKSKAWGGPDALPHYCCWGELFLKKFLELPMCEKKMVSKCETSIL